MWDIGRVAATFGLKLAGAAKLRWAMGTEAEVYDWEVDSVHRSPVADAKAYVCWRSFTERTLL